MEFGIVIPRGFAALHAHVPAMLEDSENGVPDFYRATLSLLYERLCHLREDIGQLDDELKALVKQHPAFENLMRMEGVGPIGAALLFATLGSGEAFHNGRQFSAYLGLTPKQYSSGGKTVLVGISKQVANKRLRAVLIQGARPGPMCTGSRSPQRPNSAGSGRSSSVLATGRPLLPLRPKT